MNKEIESENVRIHSRADELIACLEGEIAKRDETIARLEADNRSKNGSMKAFGEQIAGLQKAVRNRERLVGLRDARILGLESQYQRDVYGLNNEGDPIGGDPAGGYANDNARLRTELAALKAQEPVEYQQWSRYENCDRVDKAVFELGLLSSTPERFRALYAAPVSEAEAHGVVMPEREEFEDAYSAEYGTPVSVLKLLREGENYIEKPQHSDRLNSSWWMWQKARALLSAPSPAGVDGLNTDRNAAFKACPEYGCDWGSFYLGWKARGEVEQAIIDGLRGKVAELRKRAKTAEREAGSALRTYKGLEKVARVVSDNSDQVCGELNVLRQQFDQQAQRIGELASHLEFSVTLLTVAGLAGNAQVEAMRAALSAGKEVE